MKSQVSKVWRQIPCTCRLVQEVGQQAAHDSLVADNQHVFLPFQLHDHWLQTMDEVLIRLNGGETIIQTLCQVASRMTKVRFIVCPNVVYRCFQSLPELKLDSVSCLLTSPLG